MSKPMKRRSVTIERQGDSWAVCYADRIKRQRYRAATFYASDHSFVDVLAWVESNPRLSLTDSQRPVFRSCNVCGRSLVRQDEFTIGACAVCMNETIEEQE